MPSYGYYADRLTRTRWGTQASTGIETLSNPQDEIVIKLPAMEYTTTHGTKEIIASFHVSREFNGTPKGVFDILLDMNNGPGAGELIKYNDGTNTWMLGREAGFVNGQLAYIILPTNPVKIILSIDLMEKGSRLAKFIKEKIVPAFNYSTFTVEIQPLRGWIPRKRILLKPVTQESVNDLLLEHIDDFA